MARTGDRRSGGACPLRPKISDVNLFRYCQGLIYFDAQISDSAFDLCAEAEAERPRDFLCVDRSGSLWCVAVNASPIASDPARRWRSNPIPGANIPGAHIGVWRCLFWNSDSLRTRTRRASYWRPSDIHQQLGESVRSIQSDRLTGLLLTYNCAIRSVSARGNIVDFDGHDIAPTKLAVDRQIEHGEVSDATFNLEFRPD